MKSCSAICMLAAPLAARLATRASWDVRSNSVSEVRFLARSPVARSSSPVCWAKAAAPELADRLHVGFLGLATFLEQRRAERAEPERPRRCCGPSPVGQGRKGA